MNTREKIINQFVEEVCQIGFLNVRISHICKVLNIERKLFYYYFEDKYALLSAIYQADLKENFSLAQTNKNNWKSNATKLLKKYREQGEFYTKCINEDDDSWKKLFQNHMINLFQKLFIELAADNSDEVLFFAEFYASGWTSLVGKWMSENFLINQDELINRFDGIIRFTKTYIYNWT